MNMQLANLQRTTIRTSAAIQVFGKLSNRRWAKPGTTGISEHCLQCCARNMACSKININKTSSGMVHDSRMTRNTNEHAVGKLAKDNH